MLDRVREPVSEGILRTGALGYIWFFSSDNQTAFEDLLVKVVLAVLHRSPVFHLLMFLSEALVDFLVLPAYLFAGSAGKVRADESKIRAIEFDELNEY